MDARSGPKKFRREWVQIPFHKRVRHDEAFTKEFLHQLTLHQDAPSGLQRAVTKSGDSYTHRLMGQWASGETTPRNPKSFILLNRVEKHYGLPKDHFKNILLPDTPTQRAIDSVSLNQQHVMRWHLPDDFDSRPKAQRQKILSWIDQNVLSCATEFGQYMKEATISRYSLRFPAIYDIRPHEDRILRFRQNAGEDDKEPEHKYQHPLEEAPRQLVEELTDLVRFRRTTIAPPGFKRYCAWSKYTAIKQINRYGRAFGALIASPRSSIHGFGAPRSSLTMAILVFPAFWDWYLDWCERRRGFFSASEQNFLIDTIALVRRDTGWLGQHPELAHHLKPIGGLIGKREIAAARRDWDTACDEAISYFRGRIRELRRIARPHRDPFFPILTVLKSDAPLREYRKITDEILKRMPDATVYPLAAAQAARVHLIMRFAMHLGLRQRNLRELVFCPKGGRPKGDKFLQEHRCGELRWSKADKSWEVYIPALAFKNWESTFFRRAPFRALLPDLENLYFHIDVYLKTHRPTLLGGYDNPDTFFVRTLRSDRRSGKFNGPCFSSTWRSATQEYGIFNPYTGRGAIEGLLPHGPHSVRDVLATHMVKQTASFELAAFALHDTPEVVKAHYCRFLPEEKSALATKVLNEVWKKPSQAVQK